MDQVSVIHLHISILWLNMPMCLYKLSDWSMSGCDKVFAWVLHPFQVRCHVYLQTVRLKKWVLDIYFLGNALGFFWTIGITWKNDKSWLQGGCHWFQHARPHLHPVPRYWPSWLRWFSLCRCPSNLWTMWSSLVGRWQSRLRRCRTWVTAVLQSGWLYIVTYRLI